MRCVVISLEQHLDPDSRLPGWQVTLIAADNVIEESCGFVVLSVLDVHQGEGIRPTEIGTRVSPLRGLAIAFDRKPWASARRLMRRRPASSTSGT
jgi:hypothetical protein